jgi:putative methyltransferase (TIGR04325 family)
MLNWNRIGKVVRHVPVLGSASSYAFRRVFNNSEDPTIRLFRGIYPDFATAIQDIPTSRLQGYDNKQSAGVLANDRLRIYPFDYPILFWLSKLITNCNLLFDWGGHVGISYFGYRPYLEYPSALTWLVCDVGAVTELGKQIALQENTSQLRFTTSLDEIADADVLLASGSLHFIENPLAAFRSARALPPHILINRVPAYDLPSSVTVQNMGSALCPYHLFNRKDFVRCFEELGYRKVDEWEAPDQTCHIPFFPEYAIPAYTGFYFSRR